MPPGLLVEGGRTGRAFQAWRSPLLMFLSVPEDGAEPEESPDTTVENTMANLLTLALLIVATVVTAQHLRVRWETGSALDALLVARRKVWPPKPLTWAQLDQRIWRRICACLTPGVSGHIIVPANFVAWVSPEDYELVGSGRAAMEDHLATELRKRARGKEWKLTDGPVVSIRPDVDLYSGVPVVQHWFGAVPDEVSLAHDGPDVGCDGGIDATAPLVVSTTPHESRRRRERWRPRTEDDRTAAIDTVPARSYRLIGDDGFEVELDPRGGSVLIGRELDADVVLTDHAVSRRHAELSFGRGSWRLADLGSRNGTSIGGRAVSPRSDCPVTLRVGDEIRLGASGSPLKLADGPFGSSASEDVR